MKQHHNQGFASVPRWAWLWAALLLAVVALVADAIASEISGKITRVIDGDTIDVGETRIRLCGFDASEAGTEAGDAATAWATQQWLGATVTCQQTRKDRYGRDVAKCWMRSDGLGVIDIGWQAWREGHAVQWARYWRGCGYHAAIEADARMD